VRPFLRRPSLRAFLAGGERLLSSLLAFSLPLHAQVVRVYRRGTPRTPDEWPAGGAGDPSRARGRAGCGRWPGIGGGEVGGASEDGQVRAPLSAAPFLEVARNVSSGRHLSPVDKLCEQSTSSSFVLLFSVRETERCSRDECARPCVAVNYDYAATPFFLRRGDDDNGDVALGGEGGHVEEERALGEKSTTSSFLLPSFPSPPAPSCFPRASRASNETSSLPASGCRSSSLLSPARAATFLFPAVPALFSPSPSDETPKGERFPGSHSSCAGARSHTHTHAHTRRGRLRAVAARAQPN